MASLTYLLLAAAVFCGASASSVKDAASDLCYADAQYKLLQTTFATILTSMTEVVKPELTNPNPGFFAGLILNLNSAFQIVLEISKDNHTFDAQCLAIQKNINGVIESLIVHKDDVVNGTQPFTGEALYQFTLGQVGQQLAKILAAGDASANVANPTKYQASIVTYRNNINAIRNLLANNGTQADCIRITKGLSSDLAVTLGSSTDMSTDCSVHVTVPPTTVAPTTPAPTTPAPTTPAPTTPAPTSAAPVTVTIPTAAPPAPYGK